MMLFFYMELFLITETCASNIFCQIKKFLFKSVRKNSEIGLFLPRPVRHTDTNGTCSHLIVEKKSTIGYLD